LAVVGGAPTRIFGDKSLAIKPQDSDTFLREVDEELRRDRVSGFMTRYGKGVIGGAVLLLLALAAFIWLRSHREEQAGQASEKLVQVIEQLEQNNARAAAPAIDELAANGRDGYRLAALFARANAQIASNSIPAAVQTLGTITADESAPQAHRDAAAIRQVQLQFDTMAPAQVVQRLQGFAQPGNPWFGTAGEMVGIAQMRMQNYPQAAQTFGNLARDTNVPESIRARAIQMASSLGVDAVQIDPSIAEAPPPPPPAAPAQQGNAVTATEGSQ
jgi:hypothetical protein